MLKNSKVVLFLSPYKVGQAGNFWTLLRITNRIPSSFGSIHILLNPNKQRRLTGKVEGTTCSE